MTKAQILEDLDWALAPRRNEEKTTKYDDQRLRIDIQEMADELRIDVEAAELRKLHNERA